MRPTERDITVRDTPREDKDALRSHCRRVSAVAGELARRLRFSPQDQDSLLGAAEHHHGGKELLDAGARNRLLADLCAAQMGGSQPPVPGPERPRAAGRAGDLSRLIEMCCFFAQRWEYTPYELTSFEDIIEELRAMARDGFFGMDQVEALARVPMVSLEQIRGLTSTLPVFPAVALRALRLAADENVHLSKMEQLVSSDPVLAGEILKVANSPLMSPLKRISTIRQAVAFIGLPMSARVLSAAVFRPLFNTVMLRQQWNHSIEVAQLASTLADRSHCGDPEEAFLAGLLHDVGRLALWKLPAPISTRYHRLLGEGAEPIFAELLLCGFDHGPAGAEVLRQWLIPEHLIDAIENHHQPERSQSWLPSLLYLAEHWSNSREDLPSVARLRMAMERTKISSELLESASHGVGIGPALTF